jgi:hypothetical protein
MNLLMIPLLALKALRQNILCTGLTMLGIIISATTPRVRPPISIRSKRCDSSENTKEAT